LNVIIVKVRVSIKVLLEDKINLKSQIGIINPGIVVIWGDQVKDLS